MNRLSADLHLHTVLSPCADRQMLPGAIVAQAARCGLGLIAVCDHNAAANTASTQRAGAGLISVLAGIEITSREEVHVVGLFPSAKNAISVARRVLASLPPLGKPAPWMAEQLKVNARGKTRGKEPKMLAGASCFTLSQTVQLIRHEGGIAIAAHVDRPSFSVISQLGMMPTDVRFDALEVSPAGLARGADKNFASLGLPLLCSSDSHSLDEIGSSHTVLELKEPSFEELVLALHCQQGRRCFLA